MSDVKAFQALKDLLIDRVQVLDIDCIVGLDSRGFLLGPILSLEFSKPFIPIRKKGKLPGDCYSESYIKEYGEVGLFLHDYGKDFEIQLLQQ